MIKALMISIQPQHAVNILIGKKTLELRTWIPKGYVGWVYVYVTKGKQKLFNIGDEILNGKVVFRFWFDEYETIRPSYYPSMKPIYEMTPDTLYLLKLSKSQINDYGKGKDLYAWHIKRLEVFDEPKSLSNFALVSNYKHIVEKMTPYEKSMLIFGNPLKKAPQRSVWIYVADKE